MKVFIVVNQITNCIVATHARFESAQEDADRRNNRRNMQNVFVVRAGWED